jgi:hypothetical protein
MGAESSEAAVKIEAQFPFYYRGLGRGKNLWDMQNK